MLAGQHYASNETCYARRLYPNIALYTAMETRLLLSDGKVCQVASMTAEEFLDAVEVLLCGLSSTASIYVRKWLYDLDYADVVERISYARWYALEEITRAGVKLPKDGD